MSLVTWSPGDRNHRRVLNGAAEEDSQVGRAATDIDDAGAELLFVVGQHRVTRSQLLQHDVVDFEAAALDTFDDILRGALAHR